MTRLLGCFKLLRIFMLVVAVSASAIHPAVAGPLSTTNDAFSGTVNGIPGHDGGYWRGSEIVTGFVYAPPISVDVDFAVFAPGSSFDDFLTAEFGVNDPTDGTNYVYAFQATTIQDDGLFGGMTELNPGYDPNEDLEVVSQGEVVGTGILTSSFLLTGSSAHFVWASGINTPGTSAIVFYTSPYQPKPDRVNISSFNGDAGQSGPEDFASPSDIIPEPSTLALLASGIAIAFARRRRY